MIISEKMEKATTHEIYSNSIRSFLKINADGGNKTDFVFVEAEMRADLN